MGVPDADRDILRRRAGEIAQVAKLEIHAAKAALWKDLNDLRSVRPMVWINEIPWNEMDINGELALRCADS